MRGVKGLVGETKSEETVIISVTSTSAQGKRRTTVLVGENNEELFGEFAYHKKANPLFSIVAQLRHRGCHHMKKEMLRHDLHKGNRSSCPKSAGRRGTRLASISRN